MKLLTLALLAVSLVAEEHPATQAKVAPQISAELRAQFWRVTAEAIQAAAANEKASAARQAILTNLQAFCGAEFQPAADSKGEPQCEPKPPK